MVKCFRCRARSSVRILEIALYTEGQLCLIGSMSKVIIAIPARYGSTRFPGKMLAELDGKPILQHVWERAKRVRGIGEVVVLTEAQIIRDAVESWGGVCHLTPESCANGTMRIHSALPRLEADHIINVQGDEPFLDVELVEKMATMAQDKPDFDMLTPIYPIQNGADLFNPNIVKAIVNPQGRAIYFSRHPIPYLRDVSPDEWVQRFPFNGHMGIYLYGRRLLEDLPNIPESALANAESLEQLRFLEAGYRIQTIRAARSTIAIDRPEDLKKAADFIIAARV